MKISDRLTLAVKGLQGRWVMLPVAGIAIAAFCLCFAAAVLVSMRQEKAAPYDLTVTAEELDDNDIAAVQALENVTAATALLDVPATVTADDYSAQLTLTGIDGTYLKEEFTQGGTFQTSGVMPYLILNKAALVTFKKETASSDLYGGEWNNESSDDTPDISWLNANVTVRLGEKPVTSRICGILDGDGDTQESAAYISLSTAKALLQGEGQIPVCTNALVRITNIGVAKTVSQEITKLGFSVSNVNSELQTKWDGETKEMSYLIVVGAFGLLCSAGMLAAWKRIASFQYANTYTALLWMGLRQHDIRTLFTVQSLMISVVGAVIGIVISLLLPSFLTAGESSETIFMMPVPIGAILVVGGICVLANVVIGLIQQFKK